MKFKWVFYNGWNKENRKSAGFAPYGFYLWFYSFKDIHVAFAILGFEIHLHSIEEGKDEHR